MHLCVYGSEINVRCLLQLLPTVFFKARSLSLTGLELANSITSASQWTPETLQSLLSGTGTTGVHYHSWLLNVGAGESEFGC